MKILVIGSGGREHALAWKLSQEKNTVFCAPGNPGTALDATNIPIQSSDIPGLVRFALRKHIDLTVIGPEEALFSGTADVFRKEGLLVFGPTSAAAQIEQSKAFAHALAQKASIPRPVSRTFRRYDRALDYVEQNSPCFVKASGPALGKGARQCKTVEDAKKVLHEFMVQKTLGRAGETVIIEEWLLGIELSAHAVCNGANFAMLPFSKDHKRALDGDEGDNTGGMGAVIPVPQSEKYYLEAKRIVKKTLNALLESGIHYEGLLYPGLMATDSGLKVLEFNARFGDPETQVYMRHMKSCLTELLLPSIDGTLSTRKTTWRSGFSVCVVIASGDYHPKAPIKEKRGFPIEGIEEAEKIPGVKVFHAGTENRDGKLVNAGGRVLNVTCHANKLEHAIRGAYVAVNCIHFEGMRFRQDIGREFLPSG